MKFSPEHVDEMIAHAREDAPNECCGMVAARDGAAVQVFRAVNAAASPYRYEVEPRDQFRIQDAIENDSLELGAIYHSHTRSAPYPSQTDINLALTRDGAHELFPGTLYVIVGVAEDEPEVRAYAIEAGGKVREVELEIA